MTTSESHGAISGSRVSAERLADIIEILHAIKLAGDCRLRSGDDRTWLPFKADTLLNALAELQSLRSEPSEPVAWGDAGTVKNLIAQLRTFDPETPIYGAFHADAGDGRKARVRGLTLSRERVNGRLIDTGNVLVPYAIVAWTAPRDGSDDASTQPGAST